MTGLEAAICTGQKNTGDFDALRGLRPPSASPITPSLLPIPTRDPRAFHPQRALVRVTLSFWTVPSPALHKGRLSFKKGAGSGQYSDMKHVMPIAALAASGLVFLSTAVACGTGDVDLGERGTHSSLTGTSPNTPPSCSSAGGSCTAPEALTACASWSTEYDCTAKQGCCFLTKPLKPDASTPEASRPIACEAAGGICASIFSTIGCVRWGELPAYDCGGRPNIGCCLPN